MSEPYALDRDGKRIYAGDYVQCVNAYPSMPHGQRRRVLEIRPYDCISLGNGQSPVGVSDYKADRFRLAGRHHPAHHNAAMRQALDTLAKQQDTTNMLHIAIRYFADVDMVNVINNDSPNNGTLLAGRTKLEIQERVKDRIAQNPGEKWLICSGNTIAETQSPIVFRSL